MARRITLKGIQRQMARLARSINRARTQALRKGNPIPWGELTPPAPNTTRGRVPSPFTGGN